MTSRDAFKIRYALKPSGGKSRRSLPKGSLLRVGSDQKAGISAAGLNIAASVESGSATKLETAQKPSATIPLKGKCWNCETQPLDTPFCPNCGQENINYRVPLGIFLYDVLEEFIKWDGRLLKTLFALLFRPGLLTREYNEGRRVRYLSPFKMYFIVSAMFFFFFSLHPIVRTVDSVKEYIKIDFDGKPYKSGQLEAAFVAYGEKEQKENAKKGKGKKQIDDWGFQFGKQVMHALDTPGIFVNNLVQTAAKVLPFLLPLYAGFLTLLYFRQRRYYVEHLVFIAHNATLIFLLATLKDVLGHVWTGSGWLLLLFPLYEFLALRTVYRQSIGKTLFKQMIFGTFSFFLLLLGALITLVVAVMTQG